MSDASTNTFFLLDEHVVQGGAYDPSVTATDGRAGSLFIQIAAIGSITPIQVWQKQDNGVSVNWTAFGGGGGGGVSAVGAIDTPVKSANGAHITGTTIFFQTADGSFPGMLSLTAQNIVGLKSFSDPISGFGQNNVAPTPAGGTADLYVDDIILGTPVAGTKIWRQIDQAGNVRVLNGIVQDAGSPLVTAPQFLNFIGATLAPNGLGVDIDVTAGINPTAARETFVIAAPDIVNGFLTLAFTAINATVNPIVQGAGPLIGGSIAAGDDYEMSVVLGVTRVTFAPGIVAAWIVGQRVQIQYSHN